MKQGLIKINIEEVSLDAIYKEVITHILNNLRRQHDNLPHSKMRECLDIVNDIMVYRSSIEDSMNYIRNCYVAIMDILMTVSKSQTPRYQEIVMALELESAKKIKEEL